MKWLSKIFSTVFGFGYFPVAPGTLTSLAAIFLYKFYINRLHWTFYLVLLLSLFLAGVWSSSKLAHDLNRNDPRCIVIDEAVGQLLVLFRLNPSWFTLLLGFILFRFFDIVKPFPIKRVEYFPKGWGIMLDDVVAALYSGILLNLYLILK